MSAARLQAQDALPAPESLLLVSPCSLQLLEAQVEEATRGSSIPSWMLKAPAPADLRGRGRNQTPFAALCPMPREHYCSKPLLTVSFFCPGNLSLASTSGLQGDGVWGGLPSSGRASDSPVASARAGDPSSAPDRLPPASTCAPSPAAPPLKLVPQPSPPSTLPSHQEEKTPRTPHRRLLQTTPGDQQADFCPELMPTHPCEEEKRFWAVHVPQPQPKLVACSESDQILL